MGVGTQRGDRVHACVIEMPGVQAQPGDFIGNVVHQARQLVGELDVATGVGMDDGADAVLMPGDVSDGADVRHHGVPACIVQARGAVRVTGCVVAGLVAPVDDHQIRPGMALAGLLRHGRQLFEQGADVVSLAQQFRQVGGVDQVVENRPGNHVQAMFGQGRAYAFGVQG
ncbi:hypothetical protein D3C84_751280 [compost metagenome]